MERGTCCGPHCCNKIPGQVLRRWRLAGENLEKGSVDLKRVHPSGSGDATGSFVLLARAGRRRVLRLSIGIFGFN